MQRLITKTSVKSLGRRTWRHGGLSSDPFTAPHVMWPRGVAGYAAFLFSPSLTSRLSGASLLSSALSSSSTPTLFNLFSNGHSLHAHDLKISNTPPPGFEAFGNRDGSNAKGKGGESEGHEKSKNENVEANSSDAKKNSQSKTRGDNKEEENDDDEGGNKKPKIRTEVFLGLTAFLLFGYALLGFADQSMDGSMSIQKLLTEHVARGEVERLQVVNKDYIQVIFRSESERRPLSFRVGSLEAFEARLERFQEDMGIDPSLFIPIQYITAPVYQTEVKRMLPYILGLLALLMISRGMRRVVVKLGEEHSALRFSKARPATAKGLKVKVKFSDVAGMKNPKAEVEEFVNFLSNPAKYEKLGAHIPKGALLVGPPGTGKTLLAKAVAGEADVPFFSMSGSDFLELFVGVGPSRVRSLFKQARKTAPSIIFIDEIDAVGRKRARGGYHGSNDERENTLNQMLVEMDGFSSTTGVVVLAGTNRPDILDPALTRPGRFDRTINIEPPDLEERSEIFEIHLKPLKLAETLDRHETCRRLAALTPGLVGADIMGVCNEAAIMAARRGATGVDICDFEAATERILAGMKKSSGFITQELRRNIALHEAGHALAGWFLEHADPVLKVSIVPRASGALGFAQQMPQELQLLPECGILDRLVVLLAGRASEELFLGRASTGASDDLDKATRIAYSAVSEWGLNKKVGLVSFQSKERSYFKPYSERLAELIDTEVRQLIEEQYQRAKDLLKKREMLLHKLADVLLLKETITFHDLRECLGERPFPLREEYRRYIEASPVSKSIPSDLEEKQERSQELSANALNTEETASRVACTEFTKDGQEQTVDDPSTATNGAPEDLTKLATEDFKRHEKNNKTGG